MIVGFNEYKHKYQFNVTGVIHVGAHVGQEYNEYIETNKNLFQNNYYIEIYNILYIYLYV